MTREKKAFFGGRQALILALFLVTVFGAFLRLYHFSDWLHFELDQSRDMRVVDDAFVGGPGELTLLGMKAGGTSLRLGPGFYYLEYLSGLLFGQDPVGVATVIPILSVASVILFFLVARRYFSSRVSVLLAFLFSVSAFLVMYGRFAWNPNPIPFFALLGFYSLLRSVEPDGRHRGGWFVLAAFSIGFSTHLHFLAFLTLPLVFVAFLIIRRPRFSWKTWAAAVFVALVLYVPVVLNEVATGAANSKAFLAAVTEKSGKETHSVGAKLVKDVTEYGLGYLVVTTGYEGGDFPDFRRGESGPYAVCDARCQKGWPYGAGSLSFLLLSLASLLGLWWREKERRKSDLLLLSGIWFLVPFVVFLPLAYDFAPRFFLVTAPIPFLLLGFLYEEATRILPWKRVSFLMFSLVVVTFSVSNLWYLSLRFDQLSRAATENVKSPTDRILKELVRVTYSQQLDIVKYLKSRSDESGYPVYMYSEPQYRRAIKYLLDRSGVRNDVFGLAGTYEEGIYVLILRSKSDLEDGMRKYLKTYDVVGKREFGTLIMIEFRPKTEAVTAKRQVFDDDAKPNDSLVSKTNERYTWNGWWQRHAGSWDDEADSDGEEDR
ncbi:MAG: glycosyltransferase family 39 protein [Candidatus Moranbacteria bacterium]|nr:glycosyltransferase family 39 protein [Candidatus Moranbacteria bacterium]